MRSLAQLITARNEIERQMTKLENLGLEDSEEYKRLDQEVDKILDLMRPLEEAKAIEGVQK